ncbi:hypothetical protein [Candidatus Chlorohelix sp.]|uniref:hypothetical protein n=1 Tax=Candidatus Chlorohelix sp. TaxID=3139201 RepID=UPI0030285F00
MIFVFVLVQAHFMPGLLPAQNDLLPDLSLLLAVSWGLLLEWTWALPLAFFTGLALDISAASLLPIGLQALLFSIVVLFVTLISQDFIHSSAMRAVTVSLFAALGYRLMLLLAGQLLGYNTLQIQNITQVVLPVSFIDAAIMLAIFVLVRRLSKFGASRE